MLAILLVTLVIRACLLPFDIKQKKSMRNMVKLQPKMEKIKERYASNPDKQKQKTAELYREEGVSPFASCLPMLFQMLFLFAFFGAVRNLANTEMVNLVLDAAKTGKTIDLPSFLWIKNIWQPDAMSFMEYAPNILPTQEAFSGMLFAKNLGHLWLPTYNYAQIIQPTLQPYLVGGAPGFFSQLGVIFQQSNGYFILPIMSGVSAYFMGVYQSKSGMMQQQGKMMRFGLPLFSVYICSVMGAAFAVYWTFTNVLSIVQQYALNLYYKKKDEEQQGFDGPSKETIIKPEKKKKSLLGKKDD